MKPSNPLPLRKRAIASGIVSSLVFLAACGGESSQGEDGTHEIQLAHVLTDSDDGFYQYFATEFAERVDDYSDGTITVDIAGNGQLGGERDVIESLQLGSIESTIVAGLILSDIEPSAMVLDLPFLFEDYDAAETVLRDKDFMSNIDDPLYDDDLVVISWGNGAFRSLGSTNGVVAKPQDMSGLKTRLPESQIYISTFEALGASPVPMAYPEVFTGLEQGTIDAYEGPIQGHFDQSFYEAAEYFSETRHALSTAPLVFSRHFWEELSPEQQEAVQRAGDEAADLQWEFVIENEEEYVSLLEEQGVEVARDLDREPFLEAVQPVYEEYRDQIGGDVVDEIENLTGQGRSE